MEKIKGLDNQTVERINTSMENRKPTYLASNPWAFGAGFTTDMPATGRKGLLGLLDTSGTFQPAGMG